MVVVDCNIWFLVFFVVVDVGLICQAHSSVEEAKAARHNAVRKYHKKLKKQEGALRLVGGQNEYEGDLCLCFFLSPPRHIITIHGY